MGTFTANFKDNGKWDYTKVSKTRLDAGKWTGNGNNINFAFGFSWGRPPIPVLKFLTIAIAVPWFLMQAFLQANGRQKNNYITSKQLKQNIK